MDDGGVVDHWRERAERRRGRRGRRGRRRSRHGNGLRGAMRSGSIQWRIRIEEGILKEVDAALDGFDDLGKKRKGESDN